MSNKKIQDKWKESFLFGYDAISFGDGRIVIANTYCLQDSETKERERFWFPLCDTSLDGVEKYDADIWTEVDIFHGAFIHDNQKFVFGDGGMGNEGYIASTDPINGHLNWGIFFTFSNPIIKAEVKNEKLICYGDTGTIIEINLKEITEIKVSHQE